MATEIIHVSTRAQLPLKRGDVKFVAGQAGMTTQALRNAYRRNDPRVLAIIEKRLLEYKESAHTVERILDLQGQGKTVDEIAKIIA